MEQSSRDRPAVVISGASTGIGAACALDLARRGFCVFAGVRQNERSTLPDRFPNLIRLPLDVTDAGQIAAAAETVACAAGDAGLAGLVNNAGIVVAGPLEILPLEQVRLQFEVNLMGSIAVTQAFLPLLRKARGRIVNMSSLNGRIASPYLGPYSASKHALEAVSSALRSELRAWKITVSLIEPGATTTPIWEKSLAAADALAGSLSNDGIGLYKRDLDAMRLSIRKVAETASPVDSVVRCVVHALTARRPWTYYPVGLKVNLLFRAYKWVPDRIWDWIVQRSLGLPKIP